MDLYCSVRRVQSLILSDEIKVPQTKFLQNQFNIDRGRKLMSKLIEKSEEFGWNRSSFRLNGEKEKVGHKHESAMLILSPPVFRGDLPFWQTDRSQMDFWSAKTRKQQSKHGKDLATSFKTRMLLTDLRQLRAIAATVVFWSGVKLSRGSLSGFHPAVDRKDVAAIYMCWGPSWWRQGWTGGLLPEAADGAMWCCDWLI